MMFFFLIVSLATLGTVINLFLKNKGLQEKLSQIELEQALLKEKFSKIDQAINGKSYDGDDQMYGGLDGFGGTTGKVDYLEKKINSLIDVINHKFIELGKKTNSHEMEFGQSLSSEVMSNMYPKKK